VDPILWKRRKARSWKIKLKERTFVMLKPDAISGRITGEIFRRIENKGLDIVAIKIVRMDESKATELYSVHVGKDFFKDLIQYVTSGPVIPMILEGENAIQTMRKIIGSTDPLKAEMGSIRGDYAKDITQNVIHAADSEETANREMKVFFNEEDIIS
jgi:nucleoside-diphosphate kinase